jgi:hypothetical protein
MLPAAYSLIIMAIAVVPLRDTLIHITTEGIMMEGIMMEGTTMEGMRILIIDPIRTPTIDITMEGIPTATIAITIVDADVR